MNRQVKKIRPNTSSASLTSPKTVEGGSRPSTPFSPLSSFLYNHKTEKGSQKTCTHTRMGDTGLNIYAGSYHIDEQMMDEFIALYYKEVIEQHNPEYLTESQLPSDGPLLIDLDFRFPYECMNRQYTKDHIDDFVIGLLDELKNVYQFDENTNFDIYILEKPKINRVEEDKITKDGLHVIVGIKTENRMKPILRGNLLLKLEDMWGDGSLGLTNDWESVLDKGVMHGTTNWQMYGSRKPAHDAYELTYIYHIGFDTADNEFTFQTVDVKYKTINMKEIFPKLLAKYRHHPVFFYRNDFIKQIDGIENQRPRSSGGASSSANLAKHVAIRNCDIAINIRSEDDLNSEFALFMQSIETEYDLVDIVKYVMSLPEQYYGSGSYEKWIKVGWALRNRDDRLLIVWLKFSSQYSGFDYSTQPMELYEKWQKFDLMNPNGLTSRSIMYWVKTDAKEKYKEIRGQSVDGMIDRMLGNYEDMSDDEKKPDRTGCTDYDIACVLHYLFKHEYVCVSITNNIWYKFEEPRWIRIDAGTHLRKSISVELRNIYLRKVNYYIDLRSRLREGEETLKIKKMGKFIDKILGVAHRLGSTNDKKNIMTEAKELFYDDKFLDKLDANRHLICFKNGVVDFTQNVFRRAQPEDYVTKCTGIDYIEKLGPEHDGIKTDIHKFMRELFAVSRELEDYMWEHLASTLIGVLPDQTFNMYIGEGQNGKSVLTKLMKCVLGEYMEVVPLSLLTEKRTKIGGTSPEVLALKGIRLALMQEPTKGDILNEGIMKQFVSGTDPISARGLYMQYSETFYPQFKLVLASNYFMTIKSNDHGTWRRVRVIDFASRFTDNPVDGDREIPYQFKIDRSLETRIEGWKEVFAHMMVQIVFRTGGLVKDCPMVLASSNSYRQSQDYIAEFISDKVCEDPKGVITKTALSQEFTIWYQGTYGRTGSPSVRDVISYMDKKYTKCPKKRAWIGVSIRYERDEIDEDDDGVEDIMVEEL